MSTWEEAQEEMEQSGGIFAKLADGESIRGCFVGDPYTRKVIWTGERYEPFDKSDPKHKGKRPGSRMALNFYDVDEATLKVFELNNQLSKDLFRLRDKYGPDWLLEIEREGAGPKTRYRLDRVEKIG